MNKFKECKGCGHPADIEESFCKECNFDDFDLIELAPAMRSCDICNAELIDPQAKVCWKCANAFKDITPTDLQKGLILKDRKAIALKNPTYAQVVARNRNLMLGKLCMVLQGLTSLENLTPEEESSVIKIQTISSALIRDWKLNTERTVQKRIAKHPCFICKSKKKIRRMPKSGIDICKDCLIEVVTKEVDLPF